MTTALDHHVYRLRTPEDVLAMVPFLVGFHPSESLVLLAVDGFSRSPFCARTDLPGPGVSRTDRASSAKDLAVLALRQGARAVLLVAYTSHPTLSRGFLLAVRHACRRAGLRVLDVLRADGTRYWSETCRDRLCCPAEGTPYDLGASQTTVEAIFRGETALDSEDAVRATFAPVPDAEVAELTRAVLAEASAWPKAEFVDRGLACVRQVARDPRQLDATDVARLSVFCAHVTVRDVALELIRRETAEEHLALWRDVARRAPPPYTLAPLTLAAFAAWQSGTGAVARIAVERALEADPEYELARLLAKVLALGIHPAAWEFKSLDARQG